MLIIDEDKTQYINMHAVLPLSLINGPGKRGVIWMQGCPFDCVGCFNQEAHSVQPKDLLTVQAVFELLDLPANGIEGITISGGEPFYQAAALNMLCDKALACGLSIMVYSGYTLLQLKSSTDPYTAKVLGKIDILIDGLYRADVPAATLWAGSGNQQVHFLTSRYADYREQIMQNARYEEIIIEKDGFVSVTGF